MSTTDPNEVVVVSFPGEQRAAEVLQALRQLSHEHVVALKNAATIVCHANGKIEIHETQDIDGKQGTLFGALAGGLLGALKGDAIEGAVIGAAGGYVASRVIDLGFNDDYLKELGSQLTPGTSAIVAILEFAHVEDAMQTLQQFHGGHILRQTLPADVAQQLAAAVEG